MGGGSAAANKGPMGVDDLNRDAAYYKDSVEILGLSMNEMESFINPSAATVNQRASASNLRYNQNDDYSPSRQSSLVSSTVNAGQLVSKTPNNAALLQRLERMEQVVAQPRELLNGLANHEIEEIGDYCVEMIGKI